MPEDYENIQPPEEEEFDSKEEVDESEALLPDGIGMELSDVKKMLATQHETLPRNDDPLLMQVTILNAFLAEVVKLQGRHNGALKQVMGGQMEKYLFGVKKTTDSLGEVLANTSVDAIGKIFRQHDAAIERGTMNTRWCAAIVAVSALVNVVVFLWK